MALFREAKQRPAQMQLVGPEPACAAAATSIRDWRAVASLQWHAIDCAEIVRSPRVISDIRRVRFLESKQTLGSRTSNPSNPIRINYIAAAPAP